VAENENTGKEHSWKTKIQEKKAAANCNRHPIKFAGTKQAQRCV
jgi:hypothetical protein